MMQALAIELLLLCIVKAKEKTLRSFPEGGYMRRVAVVTLKGFGLKLLSEFQRRLSSV